MCASSPTARSSIPKTAKDMETMLAESMAKMPAADYIIMTAGFIAGTKGYTPLTALLKVFGQASGAGIDLFTPGWKQIVDAMTQEGTPPALESTLAMGCAGLIEAYMITRPGALAAVGGAVGSILQGIGEIVPG